MFLLAIAVTLTAWSCNHIWRLTYAEYVKDSYRPPRSGFRRDRGGQIQLSRRQPDAGRD